VGVDVEREARRRARWARVRGSMVVVKLGSEGRGDVRLKRRFQRSML
jgi:hypothetical protein